ncbi:hypothetical protein [Deinococcus misasensis]|uniref:hypothetical protein n=1 Tax=Deinococcus misasensis TaxID=392413 RepID=UPI000552584F|nr:hypothetical protein [Deinococcus misasensis]
MIHRNTIDVFNPEHFKNLANMAETFIRSRMLPPAFQSPEQVIVIICKGLELGLQPLQALSGINVIQGKPTVSPQLMLSLINRSGKLEDIKFEIGPDFVACTMKRSDRSPHTERFGTKEAQNMGLANKDNYKRQPTVMYKWRAVAACARVTFPDIIDGLYTPEEMGADVVIDEEGGMEIVPPSTPKEKTLSAEAAGRLGDNLEKFGYIWPLKLASDLVGREIKALGELTISEGTQVYNHAKANPIQHQQPTATTPSPEKTSPLVGKIMGHLHSRFKFPQQETEEDRSKRLSFMAFLANRDSAKGVTTSKGFSESELQTILDRLSKEKDPEALKAQYQDWLSDLPI